MRDPGEKDGDKKMKGKVQEVEPIPFDGDSLVLRLSSNPTTAQNKPNRSKKIFKFLKLGNSSNENDNSHKTKEKEDNKRVFECKHCDRIFSSVKGLCGHQNIHKKRERCKRDNGVRNIQLPHGSMAHGPPVLIPDQSFQPSQGFVRDGYGGSYSLLDNHHLNANLSGNGNSSNKTLHVPGNERQDRTINFFNI